MNLKNIIAAAWLLIASFNALAQTALTVPDVSVSSGMSIDLPINLTNTADVVAVQFLLTMPEGITLDVSTAALTERADGHSVVMRQKSDSTYLTMVYSAANNAFIARTGTLLTVTLWADESLETGDTLCMSISDVAIAAADGSNLDTGSSAGLIIIDSGPDLAVSDVTTNATSLAPGDTITMSWTVENVGGKATEDGWQEQLFLDDTDGSYKLLGTVYYDGTLASGAVASRSTQIVLPSVLGVDSVGTLRVKLVPNSGSGEPSWALSNNEASTEETLPVNLQLTLTPSQTSVEEGSTSKTRFYLTRSGSTSSAETFTLTATDDGRISLPESVTIPAGQSGVYFYANYTANGVLDDDSVVTLTLSGNNYSAVSATITLEDDTYPSLTLETDADNLDVNEGESFTITITTERAPAVDTQVNVTCDLSSRFSIPSSIILPAGETSVSATIEAVDDDTPDVEQVVTFKASASKHYSAELTISLLDDDLPTLQLTLEPSAVSEGAGPLSVYATLTRTDNTDKSVTIKFTDDSDGDVYYGTSSLSMAAGTEELTVNLGPIDNSTVDGERTVNISAAVWISSCSCSASSGTSGGVVTVPLTIYDDDGPTLSLSASSSVLSEGGEMTATLSRNTDTSEALSVSIVSSDDDVLSYPETVTIPAGASSTTFTLSSAANSETNDSFTATITASATNFSTSTLWFTVSDQTLPDAQITAISVSDSEAYAGDTVTIEFSLVNTGSYELAEQTKVHLYKTGSSTAVATAYLQTALAAGDTTVLSRQVTLPTSIGTHSYYAVVNDDKNTKELSYTNNTSATISVNVLSPYTSFSVATDKTVYEQGDSVYITGQVVGRDVSNVSVEVYVINSSARQSVSVTTDDDGNFSTTYTPYSGQIGHFDAGACYPGTASTESMAVFNICGLQRTSSSYIKCNLTVDESYTGSFTIKNPSDIDLTGVQVSVTTQPDDCDVALTLSETISAGSTASVGYTLTPSAASTGSEWIPLYLQITSDQAPALSVTIYYYATSAEPNLKSLTSSIKTTLTLGEDKEYPLYITNTGQGETGTISVSVPDWMTCATPSTMGSLAYGDTAQVVLRLSSNDDMTANVNVTGKIAINCANGDGITIPYTVTPVSDSTGILRVDVCDEYTYYTTEGPHVEGATVTVTNSATGTVTATGTTDSDGIFETEIPAGYYKLTVKADNHSSYSNNILLDAGTTTTKTIDLSIQAITITYEIVETEVEDQYTIVTTVTYETNVPAPVVVIDGPDSIDIDAMADGESQVLLFTLTNQGLVKAEDVEFILPDDTDEYTLTPLVSTGPYEELAAQSSIVIPILFTKIAATDATVSSRRKASATSSSMSRCMMSVEGAFKHRCGTELKTSSILHKTAIRGCALTIIAQAVTSYYSTGGSSGSSGSSSGSLGSPSGGSTTKTTATDTDYGTTVYDQDKTFCDPDLADAVSGLLSDCFIGNIPGVGTFLGYYNIFLEFYEETIENGGKITGKSVRSLLLKLGWSVIPYTNVWDCAKSVADLVVELQELMLDAKNLTGDAGVKARFASSTGSNYSWAAEFSEVGDVYLTEMESMLDIYAELFGDDVWYSDLTDTSITDFLEYCGTLDTLTLDALSSMKPESVSTAQLETFVERMNNWCNDVESDNSINNDQLFASTETVSAIEETAIAAGYESMTAWFEEAYTTYLAAFEEESSSVCATVTLQLSQSMVMTRQAFRGTLTIYNGHESEAMTDVLLNLTITDPDGYVATSHEFEVTAESLDTFEGELDLTSGWSLAAGATGTATVLYIPTKYAAPTESVEYTFGGTISYVDPFTGLVVTYDITDITLTVTPSPNLDLTYFMQRDILGDDALTTDVVEPSVEAEFSLLINNVGYGDATSVTMVTNQPSIIDNEKGLAITFELVSSQLNGGEKSLALGSSVTNDFGTISAQQTAYAQWWITSSLTGHFTDYDIEATHVTSYDNPDLTLLNEVTIHELIRSLEVIDDNLTLAGFLTNDIEDADDTPDMLYLSDGTTESVSSTASATINQTADMVYTLSITPSETGWAYGSVSDPTYGAAEIVGVVRDSDGQSLSLRNFWQTDRTLRDGKDPLYENRIHFADEFTSTTAETYTLTFEPLPDEVLAVQSIDGVPDTLATTHVESLSVSFNKTIDSETFTSDDLTCTVQGKKQDTSLISISTDDDQTFTLDFTALNDSAGNGYYTLTVQTAAITDSEGYSGSTGKTVGWTMFEGGVVQLLTDVQPATAGTIEITTSEDGQTSAPRRVSTTNDEAGDSSVDYGSTIYLTAMPETGYNFAYWTVNDEVISYDATLEQDAVDDLDVVANFELKTYAITVEYDESLGSVSGAYTGVYTHGDTLIFKATPIEDYVLSGWIIDGEAAGEEETLTLIVTSPVTVSATFVRDIYYQKLIATKGWTWVSNYLQEAWSVSDMSSNINRLLSQTDELYSDPTYGLVGDIETIDAATGYKLYVTTSFVKTFSGHLFDVAESPIVLSAGWNWIGYPYNETLEIADAITNAEEGDYLVAQDGFTGYEDSSWEGTITDFEPGGGYLYKSTSAKALIFDLTGSSTNNSSASRRVAAKSPSANVVDMHDYPATMNIIASIYMNNEEIDGANYTIYALANDECRGVSNYVGSHHYLTVYGDDNVEIAFIIVDSWSNDEYLADETLTFTQDVVGSRNAPYKLSISETTGISAPSTGGSALKVYTLTGILVSANANRDSIKHLPNGVYIINGHKYIVK